VLRVIYANWFYLSMCAMLGGLAGWACLEPFFNEADFQAGRLSTGFMDRFMPKQKKPTSLAESA